MAQGRDASRRRVAQVVTRMDIGGVPDHVMTLVEGLRKDFDVTIVCGLVDPRHAERLKAAGVGVELVPFRRLLHPVADLRLFAALWQLYRAGKYDVVHTHMSKAALVGTMAATAAGIPAIVNTAHNLGFIAFPQRLLRVLFWVYDTALFRLFVHRVVTVSELVRGRVVGASMLAADRVVSIPNGIDPRRLACAPEDIEARRREFDAGPDDILIVSVARLVWFKGLDMLVAAMPEILRAHPEVRLLLVGDGPLRDDLSRQAQALGVRDRIVFVGERSDVAAILNAADLFVLPSVSEGMPISIMEAMAAGLPVVASRVGGVPELVEDGRNGLLVTPRDPGSLAAAIRGLVGDKDRRTAMGEAGRERILSDFSAERMVRRTTELYADLISRRSAARSRGSSGTSA